MAFSDPHAHNVYHEQLVKHSDLISFD